MFKQPTSTVGEDEIRIFIEETKAEVNSLKLFAALSQKEDHAIINKSLFDKVDTLLTLISDEVAEEDAVKFFTIYWKSGDRKVIAGESFEEAFQRMGYDHTSLSIISCIHEGVTNWKFDKKKRCWLAPK